MNIIHKNCNPSLSLDKSLPVNSYLVHYIVDGSEQYDIVQSNGSVEIFDNYYDQYGKNSLKNIQWTKGTVNPRLYGYKSKDKKNK